nr:MAG: replication associated protein [Cressdnaviricota sp.]
MMAYALQWSFTQNNIQQGIGDWKEIDWCLYQLEIAPTTGHLHVQGTLKMLTRKRLSQMKALLTDAHWEVTKSLPRMLQYCQKVESRICGPYSIGPVPTRSMTTMKSGPSDIVAAIRSSSDTSEVLINYPNLWRSVRAIECVKQVFLSPRSHLTKGIVLSGESGRGKSKIAGLISAYVGSTAWLSSTLKWFDGYGGEDLVIFDEFRHIHDVSMLLRILDRYPMRVEIKGGFVQWKPHMCIFTTNLSREQLYGMLDSITCSALDRRLSFYRVY